jgi:hypothetical protein
MPTEALHSKWLPSETDYDDAEKLRAIARAVNRFAGDLDHGRHPNLAKLLTAFEGLADHLRHRLEGDDEQSRLEAAESVIPSKDGPVGEHGFRLQGVILDLQPRALRLLKELWAAFVAGNEHGIAEADLLKRLYGGDAKPFAVRSAAKALEKGLSRNLAPSQRHNVQVYFQAKRLHLKIEED